MSYHEAEKNGEPRAQQAPAGPYPEATRLIGDAAAAAQEFAEHLRSLPAGARWPVEQAARPGGLMLLAAQEIGWCNRCMTGQVADYPGAGEVASLDTAILSAARNILFGAAVVCDWLGQLQREEAAGQVVVDLIERRWMVRSLDLAAQVVKLEGQRLLRLLKPPPAPPTPPPAPMPQEQAPEPASQPSGEPQGLDLSDVLPELLQRRGVS